MLNLLKNVTHNFILDFSAYLYINILQENSAILPVAFMSFSLKYLESVLFIYSCFFFYISVPSNP